MAWAVEYRAGGVYLPALDLWLDPPLPQTRGRVFVSHAHADHAAPHAEMILTEPTWRLLQVRLEGRLPEDLQVHVLPLFERRVWSGPQGEFALTLLPAGHMLGSAMAWIEFEGSTLLYTGDFKLRPGRSAEPCRPKPAHALILETTYGRPEYRFPPTAAVLEGVVRFCRETLAEGQTAVLLGYSLGKSQELLCSLAEAGLPLMLHDSVHKLTEVYASLGQVFPPYQPWNPSEARGKVLIFPPAAAQSGLLRHVGPCRSAVLTGWAMDASCRFRYQADAAFPLSDHADFDDLQRMVELVQPQDVLTLHGFAADFAGTLRRAGYKARALSQDEQLELHLQIETPAHLVDGACSARMERNDAEDALLPQSPNGVPPDRFALFATTCAAINATPSKKQKVHILADTLARLSEETLGPVTVWFTGLPFAAVENKVLRLGWALLRDALCEVAGLSERELRMVYLKHSDLGETAAELYSSRPPPETPLSLTEVIKLFEELHAARGPRAKLPALVRALRQCTAVEAKYLIKIITGDLRIGLKAGLVEEAIAQAFQCEVQAVREAHLVLGHLGETARLARAGRIDQAALVLFRPLQCMLASPEPTAEAVWQRMVETCAARSHRTDPSASAHEPQATPTVWLEDKYDGIRCQLHKQAQRVALFSRDVKPLNATFPELVEAARQLRADVVLDGEILAMRDDRALPFAALQKRLGRQEADLFMPEEVPVVFMIFDLLWLDGETFLRRPLRERRAALETLSPLPEGMRLAQLTLARSPQEINAAFAAARQRGNEGLVAKDPGSLYHPGRRGLAWLKLKRATATLDCVVVGAEYGHGKRKSVLSDYTFAVRDERTGQLKVIGKAYSGLTDEEIARLTEHFLSRVRHKRGRYHEVEPDVVLEIAFDRIQPSKRHDSGLALRFPRIVRIRTDKTVADIDTLETARKLAGLSGAR